jgi:hypothetical protein
MRSLIAAILAVAAGLLIASTLGVAAAEAPTITAPIRTVSVQGVANVAVAQGASAAVATAAYRQAMADAVLDGQSKAEFLAGKVGATVGSVQSVVEGGGSISCTNSAEESGYAEYEGEQPDFGSGSGSVSPVESAKSVAPPRATVAPKPKKKKKKTKRPTPTAKKATVTSCALYTQVALVDDLN